MTFHWELRFINLKRALIGHIYFNPGAHPTKILKINIISTLLYISIRKVKINLNFSDEKEKVRIILILGFFVGWAPASSRSGMYWTCNIEPR